jgi:hypothetical protein
VVTPHLDDERTALTLRIVPLFAARRLWDLGEPVDQSMPCAPTRGTERLPLHVPDLKDRVLARHRQMPLVPAWAVVPRDRSPEALTIDVEEAHQALAAVAST